MIVIRLMWAVENRSCRSCLFAFTSPLVRLKGTMPGSRRMTGCAPANEQWCVYLLKGAFSGMTHGLPKTGPEKLAQHLKDLRTEGDDELKERWRKLYGTEPPNKIHRSLLIPAIAYRMQENALGALEPSACRHLMRVARNAADGRKAQSYPGLSPKPGTVLVRDWGGITHQVKVLEHGLLFRGKRYKSLSKVARVITGSRWSGPLFFGLKSAVKEQGHLGTR